MGLIAITTRILTETANSGNYGRQNLPLNYTQRGEVWKVYIRKVLERKLAEVKDENV